MVDQCDTYNKNLDVLANAIELAVETITASSGNAISSNVNGQEMTNRTLADLIGAKLQARFAAQLARSTV